LTRRVSAHDMPPLYLAEKVVEKASLLGPLFFSFLQSYLIHFFTASS